VSSGLDLREKALACGLLPRILERLSVISGEKPRIFEEVEEIVDDKEEEIKDSKETAEDKKEPANNTVKAKRKGTGYSSK
jgi:hypothetical protein